MIRLTLDTKGEAPFGCGNIANTRGTAILLALLLVALPALVWGQRIQGGPAVPPPKKEEPKDPSKQRLQQEAQRDSEIKASEQKGVQTRIKEIARFRGYRPNQLMGMGIVVGLAGTGDTKKSLVTQSLIANLMKDLGLSIDASQIEMKNCAAVMITAELPAFATNGLPIDVNVQSMGDAKSIAGGTLLQAPLFAAGDRQTVYAMAQGQVTVGGFLASSGGSSQSKNFVTAGRVPAGAVVEKGAPANLVFDGKMYLDLDFADMTTAERIAKRTNEKFPALNAVAINAGTVELTLPEGASPVNTMAQLEQTEVMVDVAGTIVINERTGTIVIGGNVRVGPAVIAHGSLSVRIDEEVLISQPAPFTNGQTAIATQSTVNANESTAQVATIAPTTTVADLAKLFQALDLKAQDIISILQGLRQQGALKARIIVQ